MVGSVLNRHDNVHRQLAAFTELLRRVQLHYANDQLRQMLFAVCTSAPEVPRWHADQQSQQRMTIDSGEQSMCNVTSLFQIRRLVSQLRSGGLRQRGIQHQERRSIVVYFERFFDDLDRLRELKRYFHERIYACLYQHYYNVGSATSTMYVDEHRSSGRPLATVLDQSDNDAPSFLDGQPLSEIVHQLWTLNREWDLVLSPEEVDDGLRTDEEKFAKITSIVPNWVEIGFKALQLAKIWWTTANRVYGNNPSLQTSHGREDERVAGVCERIPYTAKSDENDDVGSLEDEVATLNDCANRMTIELDSLRDELILARKHGRRVETLYKKLKEAEKQEFVARKHHDDVLKLTTSPDNDSTDISVLQKLDRASMELDVARYRVQLIQGDLDLASGIQMGRELHRQPLEDELQSLEEQLQKTLSAKHSAEDRLKSVNTERTSGSTRREDQRAYQQRTHPVSINNTSARWNNTRSQAAGVNGTSRERFKTATIKSTKYAQRV